MKDIHPGAICRAISLRPGGPAALVLITATNLPVPVDVMGGRDIAVTLLSPDLDLGTSLDLLLPSAMSGLSYGLLIESDVFGYLSARQLDRRLGQVPPGMLVALRALHAGDPANMVAAGPPAVSAADPRWGFKVNELARLRALDA